MIGKIIVFRRLDFILNINNVNTKFYLKRLKRNIFI